MPTSNKHKTINQLTGSANSEVVVGASYLVNRIVQLCDTPISELEIEDYRLLINQGIALEYLIPGAIEILSQNLFAEGDYYEGDLLKSVLTVDKLFWKSNPLFKNRLQGLCMHNFESIKNLDLSDDIKEILNALVKEFLSI